MESRVDVAADRFRCDIDAGYAAFDGQILGNHRRDIRKRRIHRVGAAGYQADAIEELRRGFLDGHLRQMLGLGTGTGKTVIASHIAYNAAQKGKRVLLVGDAAGLVDPLLGEGLYHAITSSQEAASATQSVRAIRASSASRIPGRSAAMISSAACSALSWPDAAKSVWAMRCAARCGSRRCARV